MQGTTIQALATQMGRRIVGLRRQKGDQLFPDEQTVVGPGDQLMVLTESIDPGQSVLQSRAEPKKLVFVEDNPVIIKTYTRLFQ
jgi:uncharacterized protein with PhoU and TrkA domain